MTRRAPYRSGFADATPLPHAIGRAPWLGPREVAEAKGWPLLSLGGTPSQARKARPNEFGSSKPSK